MEIDKSLLAMLRADDVPLRAGRVTAHLPLLAQPLVKGPGYVLVDRGAGQVHYWEEASDYIGGLPDITLPLAATTIEWRFSPGDVGVHVF